MEIRFICNYHDYHFTRSAYGNSLPMDPRVEGDQGFFSISSRPPTPTKMANGGQTSVANDGQNPVEQMDSAAPHVGTVGAGNKQTSLLSVTRLVRRLSSVRS